MPAPDELDLERWVSSGALALTGPAGGPGLGPPRGIARKLEHLATDLARRTTELGRPVRIDPWDLLTERAARLGLRRGGTTSCGGASRLLPTADGWIAVSLPRPDDVDLVPAWLDVAPIVDLPDAWPAVERAVADRRATDLVEAGALLGLAVSCLGERAPSPEDERGVAAQRIGDSPARTSLDGVVVVELASLWAGPLCGSLLADAGATVVKVESVHRPDGARLGHQGFFDLLNAGKRSVALDLGVPAGQRDLIDLLERADVVIEGSRPRALTQLGVDARSLLGRGRPSVWASITGHGRSGAAAERIGFGDDAAVAGGLVARDDDGAPSFLLDAVADPLTGLTTAVVTLELLARGGTWMIDAPLAGVAAGFAGETIGVPGGAAEVPPSARRDRGRAAALGAHGATAAP